MLGRRSLEMSYPFQRMTRAARGLLAAWVLLVPMQATAQPRRGAGGAQGAPSTATTDAASSENQARAQQHFQRAKDLYAAGSYREAVVELEAARALDPKAKDLVFNLGIVHEKLAKYDEAITYFRQYMDMDGVTTQEKQKADSVI